MRKIWYNDFKKRNLNQISLKVGENMKKVLSYIICSIFSLVMLVNCRCIFVSAEGNTISASSKIYVLDEKEKYSFENKEAAANEVSMGTLSLVGDIRTNNETKNGLTSFSALSDNDISISYQIDTNKLTDDETEWHIKSDNRKAISDIQLGAKVESGAIVVQTSFDGINWVTEKIYTNVFTESSSLNNPIYTTKDIQLQNGCYYRVIAAYKMEKRVEDGKILFFDTKNYDTKDIVEVYDFYIIDVNTEKSSLTFDTERRYEFKDKINTGKDNGYSGNEPIDNKDPHMGWDIGKFAINGYTQQITSADGNVIFLKTVGDDITLWFSLSQNINKLDGDENKIIAEDKNGYDRDMDVPQTNFGRGTLIIRHTDYQNKKSDPIIYTNYLEANTRTGAETRIRLYEEGDYDVTLDYEIKSGIKITDYKISFKFQIRNGNCMVFPKDNKSGKELSDYEITENGFSLDMARSRYLTIYVTRSVISEKDGRISLDQRFNRPANETDVYTEEGIYTFTVSNEYTNREMTKTIYVGKNDLYKLLKMNNNSVDEINQKLSEGYSIGENGELIEPVIETEPPVTETEIVETTVMETETLTATNSEDTDEQAESEEETQEEECVDAFSETDITEQPRNISVPIIAVCTVVIAAVAFIKIKK